MKKIAKYSLFAAGGCIILGIVIMAISFLTGSYKGQKLNYESHTLDLDAKQYTALSIEESYKNLFVTTSPDDKIHITYYTLNDNYDISTQGSELVMTNHQDSFPFSIINFDILDYQDISTVVEIPENLQADITLSSASGEINMDAINSNELNVSTASGDICIQNCYSKNSISLSSSSGEIDLINSMSDNNITLNSVSGDITATFLKAASLSDTSTSGDLELLDINIQSVSAKTSSGDIDIDKLSSENIILNTISGNIQGSILNRAQNYSISWSTVSGNTNLPLAVSDTGNTLSVKTTSGDCYITFES